MAALSKLILVDKSTFSISYMYVSTAGRPWHKRGVLYTGVLRKFISKLLLANIDLCLSSNSATDGNSSLFSNKKG